MRDTITQGGRFAALILLALLILVPLRGFAQVPQTISYQGTLTDVSGNPINGPVNITFNLYDNPDTAFGLLWTEGQTVTVTNGTFSVILGADTMGNPLTQTLFEIPLFLGLAVGGDAEMIPRQALTAVGYAFRAKTVESDTLSALSCTPGEIPKFLMGGTWACAADDSNSDTLGTLFCTDGEVAKFVMGSWVCAADDSSDTLGALSCAEGEVPRFIMGSWVCNNTGDITGVTAGTGLTGGAASGDVTLSVDYAGSGSLSTTARSDHNHNTVYSLLSHNHDSVYAPISHNHSGSQITANSITQTQIATNGVGAAEIAANAVGPSEVINNSLTTLDLAAGSVSTSEIEDDSVTSVDIMNGTITGTDIAANAITQVHIATNGVASAEVLNNSLTANDLATNSVGALEISSGAVGVSELADLARGVGVNGSIVVPGSAFQPDQETRDYFISSGGYIRPGSVSTQICLSAPVALPHGVTITHFEISVVDNSNSGVVGPFNLRRVDFANGSFATLGTVESTGAANSIRLFADTSITIPTVDGFTYTYQIHGCMISDPTSTSNIRLNGARIRYN